MLRLLLLLLLAVPALAAPTLTLVLVREKEACGRDYLDRRGCLPLPVEKIQQWIDGGRAAVQQQELRPGDQAIQLSEDFYDRFRRLVTYETFPSQPDRRWAMVMLFDFGTGAPARAVLVREAGQFPRDSNALTVSARGRALTHQRADAFKPSKSTQWRIDAGGSSYSFWMKRP